MSCSCYRFWGPCGSGLEDWKIGRSGECRHMEVSFRLMEGSKLKNCSSLWNCNLTLCDLAKKVRKVEEKEEEKRELHPREISQCYDADVEQSNRQERGKRGKSYF